MRLKSILLSGAVAAAFLNTPLIAPNILNLVSTAQAQNASISFSVFYDGLRDDGDWTDYNGSYVFVPSNIDANWRPYTRGHWVHTAEFGWVWKSAERFGWATYHYGRWGYARDIGWYWVPGRRWTPAWVSWRRTDREVLWAPLPPTGYDDEGFASDASVTLSALPVYFWVSISARNFQDPNLSARIVFDANQNQRIFDRSQFDGPVVIQNNTVINNVINVNFIQQQTGQPVQNVAVTTTTNPAAAKAPQPGQQNAVTAFQGQLTVDPAVKPVDVKPVAQIQQKVVNQPKLPTDTAPPSPAATPAAGATKPAAGVQTQGNVQAPTPKPGDAVTPPKNGATVVPLKPVDTAPPAKLGTTPTPKPGDAVTPPKDGATVVPLKPVDTVPPPKDGTTVVPLKPVDTVPPAKLGTTPTLKPGDAVSPPKDSTTIVPLKPADTVTPPKAGATVVPLKPVDKVPPAKLGTTPVAPKVDALPVPKAGGIANPPAVPMNKQLPVTPPVQAKPIPANPPAIQVLPKDVAPAQQMDKQPVQPKGDKPANIKKKLPPNKVPDCKQGEKDCPPING